LLFDLNTIFFFHKIKNTKQIKTKTIANQKNIDKKIVFFDFEKLLAISSLLSIVSKFALLAIYLG